MRARVLVSSLIFGLANTFNVSARWRRAFFESALAPSVYGLEKDVWWPLFDAWYASKKVRVRSFVTERGHEMTIRDENGDDLSLLLSVGVEDEQRFYSSSDVTEVLSGVASVILQQRLLFRNDVKLVRTHRNYVWALYEMLRVNFDVYGVRPQNVHSEMTESIKADAARVEEFWSQFVTNVLTVIGYFQPGVDAAFSARRGGGGVHHVRFLVSLFYFYTVRIEFAPTPTPTPTQVPSKVRALYGFAIRDTPELRRLLRRVIVAFKGNDIEVSKVVLLEMKAATGGEDFEKIS